LFAKISFRKVVLGGAIFVTVVWARATIFHFYNAEMKLTKMANRRSSLEERVALTGSPSPEQMVVPPVGPKFA
jgi:hypothetical protein